MNKLIPFIILGLLPLSSMAGGNNTIGGGGAGGLDDRVLINSPIYLGMIKELITHSGQQVKVLADGGGGNNGGGDNTIGGGGAGGLDDRSRRFFSSWFTATSELKAFKKQLKTFANAYIMTSRKKVQAGDLIFASPSVDRKVIDYYSVPPAELTDEDYELILNSEVRQNW